MNSRNTLVDLQAWLGYDHLYTVDPVNIGGGLALFWKNSVDVSLLYADKNILDVHIIYEEKQFNLSCVYGNPNSSLRHIVWERLSRFGVNRRTSWCMVGDFNEILNNSEKLGGPRRGDATFCPFSDMLNSCGMTEFPGTGNSFTWSGRRGTLNIQCKLDRAFGNSEWFKQFPASNQVFLAKRGSDHRPVLIRLLSSQDSYKGSFKFDRRMFHKPMVKEAILHAWNNPASSQTSVTSRIRNCRKALSLWKKENKANSQERITCLQNDLEQEESSVNPSTLKINILKRSLLTAYRDEENFWKQKSKDDWILFGDGNTKVFHTAVKISRARNEIVKLFDKNGNAQRSEASKAQVAISYFCDLFKSSNSEDYHSMLRDLTPRVSEAMNHQLISKVTPEEIKEAVFSIKPDSAPGADGMSGFFFQSYWDIVGVQLIKEVSGFFETGVMPTEWNYTQLVLIPKKTNATLMSDLRPISLCSVMYKTISKIIASRLKRFLPDIVSPSQSAFVADRLISDNIIMAHEAIHSLNTHDYVSSNFLAAKTDMSKAFDRVEWNYLKALLLSLGFHPNFVVWIMACVSTVQYTVLINGQAHGLITPHRGLRQGDPMSPFLFVLCTEGLSFLLNQASEVNLLNGIQFSSDGPAIHHLFFADDSLFLFKADLFQCQVFLDIFRKYEQATGQVINLDKSSLTFGKKVDTKLKEQIQLKLGIFSEGGAGTYLGLPECFSGSKIQLLNYIQDKMKGRMSGWYTKFLSQAGKEVILKSVALAMPIHAMSCFRLPKTTCKNLTSAMANFWWNSTEDKGKIHWLSWDKLSVPKELGGMGFKNIETFNQALLAKQAWRILSSPDSLLSRFLMSRYFPQGSFLNATIGSRPSYAWRSICFGRELLTKGLRHMVGDGKSLSVWTSPWLVDGTRMRSPLMKNILIDLNLSVNKLLMDNSHLWNQDVLQDLFFPQDIEIIIKIKPVISSPDFFIWNHTRSGEYSVKSGYWLAEKVAKREAWITAETLPSLNGIKEHIWSLSTAPKIKIFIWKAVSGALSVADNLIARGMKVDSRCQCCGLEGESINHVLFICSVARQTWALSNFPLPPNGFDATSIFSNIFYVLKTSKNNSVPERIRRSGAWILWNLWKNRNSFFFEGKLSLGPTFINSIFEEVDHWFLIKSIDKQEKDIDLERKKRIIFGWKPPPISWFKCDIGCAWDQIRKECGASWFLRNSDGVVLLHGRRSFSGIASKHDASLECWLWAIECLKTFNYNSIIFVSDDHDFIGAISKPSAWPSLRFYSSKILLQLNSFQDWKVQYHSHHNIKGANLVAKSVIAKNFFQSYIARGFPQWLHSLFC